MTRRAGRTGTRLLMLSVSLHTSMGALDAQVGKRAGVPSPDTVVVALDDLLRIAAGQNLWLRAASADARGEETYHRTAWSQFDPRLSIGGEYEGRGIGAQVAGQLPTGATYLIGSVAPSTLPSDPAYADAIVARIDQPVLRGLGLYSARNVLRAADEGVAASQARLQRAQDELATAVRVAYATLVQRHRQEAAAQSSVDRAQELLHAYTKLRAMELITKLDSITAELGVASRRTTLLELRRQRLRAEDALLFTVYGAEARVVLAREGDVTWMPGDPAFAVPEIPVPEEAITLALGARPDFAAALHDVAQARYRSQHAHNAALPTLNLSASFSSTRYDTLPGAGVAFDARHEEWRFGVVLSRPLLNAGATAERDRAVAAADRAEAQLAEAENIVRQEVRAAIRDIELAQEQVSITANASEMARRQYGMEVQRLQLGLTDIFRVLQYEEQVGAMERAEADAWLAYAKAVALYRLAIGERQLGN